MGHDQMYVSAASAPVFKAAISLTWFWLRCVLIESLDSHALAKQIREKHETESKHDLIKTKLAEHNLLIAASG